MPTKELKHCTYITDVSAINLDTLAELYGSVGFGSTEVYKAEDEKFIETIFGPGAYGFFAFTEKDHRLVGLLRVLSDDKVCSWVAEICVHPEVQGNGIGGKLLDMAIDRFGHTAIYLEAFADQTEFFAGRGIKPKQKLVACSRAGQAVTNQENEPFLH